MGSSKVELMVISNDYQAIREGLLHKLDCGATLMNIETGFTGQKQLAVMSILTGRKLNEAKALIQDIDSSAFMIISSVTEVRGRGFTLERQSSLAENRSNE